MVKSYPDITRNLSANLKHLRKEIPEATQAFSGLAGAALRDGALDKKTKELIALGIGISTRCDGCIGFHTEALIKLGVSREEFREVLSMAIYMGGGPSLMYAADAMAAFEQYTPVSA
jgi:AhpD family alkylhydroperoxidase